MLPCCAVPDYRELMRLGLAGRDRQRQAEERPVSGSEQRNAPAAQLAATRHAPAEPAFVGHK